MIQKNIEFQGKEESETKYPYYLIGKDCFGIKCYYIFDGKFSGAFGLPLEERRGLFFKIKKFIMDKYKAYKGFYCW
jgi:hypothetical protein